MVSAHYLNSPKRKGAVVGKYGYVVLFVLAVCLLVSAGCAELAKIGKGMQSAGEIGNKAGDYVPVYGIAIKAVSGILALVGAGLYRVASRRGTAIQTLVEAVRFSKENQVPIKEAVRAMSGIRGVAIYIDKWAQKYDPKKPVIPIS